MGVLACKNSINWQSTQHPGVLGVLRLYPAAHIQIFRGAVSAKRREVPIEMRLVIEPGLIGDACQVNRLGRVHRAQDVCKAVETRHFFGWDADEALELVSQMILADANLIAQPSNGQGSMLLSNLHNSSLNDL